MTAYVIIRKRLIIFYSFKCGNSSLAAWLYSILKPRRETPLLTIRRPRLYLATPNISVPIKQAVALKKNNGFSAALIVRNPYERAVSAYINKFIVDGDDWIINADHYERFIRHSIGQHETKGVSFRDFLGYLQSRRQGDGRISVNPHFSPQLPRLCGSADFFDDILRLEHIERDFSVFLKKYRFQQTSFPKVRSTNPKRFTSSNAALDEELNFSLAERQLLPSKENLLNPLTRELIYDIYRSDFEAFGYSK